MGGMQEVSRRHIRWLGEAGHELMVVHSRISPSTKLDLPGKHVLVPWPQRNWAEQFRPWRYANDLRAFSQPVTHIIDGVRPQVIYAEGPLLNVYLERPHWQRRPVIFHPHGLEMYQGKGSWLEDAKSFPLRGMIRRHALSSDIVLSQGGRVEELLVRKIGTDRSRIRFLPNCCSGELANARRDTASNRNRFLFVGRDEHRKGLSILMRALAFVEGAKLSVAGHSGQGYESATNVVFFGEVRDRSKLNELYAQADFLVVPSLAEGMPTVILEAFSFGLPVIASDVGAVNVMVTEGETGFLVPRGKIYELVDAIKSAMNLPPARYEQMRSACLAQASGAFSPERVRSMLLAIVAEVTADKADAHV
jgi:glycosyltransferase involved in cell wall biosynthesis